MSSLKMIEKTTILVLSLVLLLFILPSSFATDVNENNDILSLGTETVNEDSSNDDIYRSSSADIYFNASAPDEKGDGSIDSPYKSLYEHEIKENSTIHLAEGEYVLDTQVSLKEVTFIGAGAGNTVITVEGKSAAFLISEGSYASFYNLTLSKASIINYGTLTAENVIFEYGVASIKNDISFGGAIYNYFKEDYNYNLEVYLDNCTFYNNTAYYGGAIYMQDGTLSISNTKFIDNSAYSFGGSIAIDGNATVTISNSSFSNSYSETDAGGAIYSKSSDLEITSSNFTNCSGSFGGAICDLGDILFISDSNFMDNSAVYSGGAIYKMYGTTTLSNSNLTNNNGKKGGAAYFDSCDSINLNFALFALNSAEYGGAIYSNLNSNIIPDNTTFIENIALHDNNIHEESGLSLILEDNDYEIYIINSNDTIVLPTSYNLVEEGFVTSIKNSDNCWAFATLAALQSAIVKAGGPELDLSEENLKNLMGQYSDYGMQIETNNGVVGEIGIAYLVNWLGPVSENDDAYDSYSTLSPLLDSIMHVQNIAYLPRSSFTDNDAIKEAIYKYGAVYTTMYYNGINYSLNYNSYYSTDDKSSNHAVVIVGWDDNYSKYNFKNTPSGDGAFIVKHCGDESKADNGYFYVSYYDANLAKVGDETGSYVFILNETLKYNKNYQYDISGVTDYFETNQNSVWYKNVFSSTGEDLLAAFSTYFNSKTDYEVYVYVNGDLKLTQSGTIEAGYYTIHLNEYVYLTEGDEFTIAIKVSSEDGNADFPVSQVSDSATAAGNSYYSLDGTKWNDLYAADAGASQVACIKAFTLALNKLNTTITIESSTVSYNQPSRISAIVKDENGEAVTSGSVLFIIDGERYVAQISNGKASIDITFNKVGDANIVAIYEENINYTGSSAEKSISVSKADIILVTTIKDITYQDRPSLIVYLTDENYKPVSGVVKLTVNNKSYTSLINGNGVISVSETLNSGDYKAIIEYLGSDFYKYQSNELTFTINKHDVHYTIELHVDDSNLHVILSTIENVNGIATFTIGDEQYNIPVTCGVGELDISDLDDGDYNSSVTVTSRNYVTEHQDFSFTIECNKNTLTGEDITMYYQNGTRYTVTLKDGCGNSLANKVVTFTINGVSYNRTTNSNGQASLAINLNSGTYGITAAYAGNEEGLVSISNTVTVLSTIESKDIVKYFRNDTQYHATVYDKQGHIIKNSDVVYNINGVFYNRPSDNDGVSTLSINLNPGVYIITALNQVTGERISNTVTVLPTIINNHDLVKYYKNGSAYSVQVLDAHGNPLSGVKVTFNINGVFYSKISDSNGYAKLNINLNPGKYIITAECNGFYASNNITVKSIIKCSDLVMDYADGSSFDVTILDGNGKACANQKVSFNCNGIIYYKTTDANGIASLDINAKPGNYIITTSYNGYSESKTIYVRG